MHHKKQTDHMVCIRGMTKLALYDSRKSSPTYKRISEIFFGDRKPLLVKIPAVV